MLSTPRKRYASRSPEGIRHIKRQLTSSPEEGEVDDSAPPPAPPVILPISLPAKPPPPARKVPFPFKKKVESSKNGADGEKEEGHQATSNVFDRFEAEARRKDDSNRNRGRIGAKNSSNDHWEPRTDSLLSRIEPFDTNGRPSFPIREGRGSRDRDRRRSPMRGFSPPPSRSPGSPSHYRSKHRLPAPRSPEATFSPPSQRALDKTRERSRDRGHDRERDRGWDNRDRWDDDSRRHGPRNSIVEGSNRHYRPHPNNYRRGDDRDWTRIDDSYRSSNRDERGYGYDRRDYDSSARRSDARPPSRPVSPGQSIRSGPVSPLRPPPPLPFPSLDVSQPPLLSVPPPPPSDISRPPSPSPLSCSPPIDSGPRPPSSSPPPAPPPDVRLLKEAQLPAIHAQVKITMKRPDAPRNLHSPLLLELAPVSTAQAMSHGLERKDEPSKQPEPLKDTKRPLKDHDKASDHPKVQELRRKHITKRTPKEEALVFGHGFFGCGQQADYETTTKLGEGTFGEVHKAIHKSTGAIVALKRILMHNEKEGMPVTALREIKILKALKHPCIVDILDMFVVRSTEDTPLSVFMVFPYMDHDLAGLLENERVKLQPSHIKLYMKQLLEGTEYMHRNNILHRDMKAANLLISNNGSLRIADFGLARTYDSNAANGRTDGQRGRERKYTNCVVTRWYRPPELLLGARHYGGEVDIWGIGCVLGEMFTRKPILPGTSDLDQLEKIWFLCGSPNQHNWPYFDQLPGCEGVIRFNSQPRRLKQTYDSVGPETVDLLDCLLSINPKERITAEKALEHDYFWTDPMPADPKSMPSYEASHEFDKRGHRHHQPMPVGPPPLQAHHHPNQPPRHGPPGNHHFNNRGPPNQRHGYGAGGSDMHRRNGPRGGPPAPYHHNPNQPPPNGPPHPMHPGNFRGMNHNLPPPPNPYGRPPPNSYGHPAHGQFPSNLPQPPYPPPGPPRHHNHPNPHHHGNGPMSRNDRWDSRGGGGPSRTLPPGLPPKPVAPLGNGTRENDRDAGGHKGNGYGELDPDRRVDPPPPGEPGDGPPGGVLNYG